MEILVITGPPYSGKGTQCEKLEELLQFKHISTGVVIREHKDNNTPLGLIMKEYEEKGLLVPDEIMKKLLSQIFNDNSYNKGIILDGYPRTISQVNTLIDLANEMNINIGKIINIEVPNEELLQRAKERAKNSDRIDDQDESIHLNRIKVFRENTKPAIDYIKTKLKVIDINGFGSKSDITKRILESI